MRVYRASALGYSLEALVAGHLGYEPIAAPDWLQRAFDEGNRIEPLCLEKLRARGWNIEAEQKEVELEVIPGVAKVVGHLDGILTHSAGDSMVLEIKSMNGKTWKKVKEQGFDAGGIMDKYAWQISAYIIATGLSALMVFWNKDDEELHSLEVDKPFFTFNDITAKIAQAEAHIEAGTLPEGCMEYPCPFFHLHAPSDNPVMPADEELDELMAKWLSLDSYEKAYKREKDAVRAEMLAITGTEGIANVRGSNGVTVTTTWQEAKEYTTRRKEGWITKVSAPRRSNAE